MIAKDRELGQGFVQSLSPQRLNELQGSHQAALKIQCCHQSEQDTGLAVQHLRLQRISGLGLTSF